MSSATRWIVAIVGLLTANLLAMAILIGAAQAGRSRVIPDYYRRATHHDDAIAQAATNRALGWRVTARWDDGIAVEVADRDGTPLRDARVHVTSQARTDRQVGGIHDVTIVVEKGGARYVEHTTVDAR
jgi:hypothetical protein